MSIMPAHEAPRLDDLAEAIRSEHLLGQQAAISSVAHAIRCGEALLAARPLVPRGQWERWLDENCPQVASMSRLYMRLATYREMIPPEAASAIDAHRALGGLPAFDGSGPRRHPPEVRDRALELYAEGVSQRLISAMLGIDRKCVRRWLGKDGSDNARRNGRYRTGRPTRREQKQREAMVRGAQREAFGPVALASCFRSVVEANRGCDDRGLADALDRLAESARAWAEQIRAR